MRLDCSGRISIQNGIGTFGVVILSLAQAQHSSTDAKGEETAVSVSCFLPCSLPFSNQVHISAQDSANPGESSLDAFASHAATWAKQCLAFRSSKTWSPTRPCCRDNLFLAHSITKAVGSEMICQSNPDPFSPTMRTILEEFGKKPKHDFTISNQF